MNNKLARKVIERDNYQCQECNARGQDLHHIVFKSHGGLDVEKNLILLCRNCHEKAHANDRVYRERFIAKQREKYDSVEIRELKGWNKWEKTNTTKI